MPALAVHYCTSGESARRGAARLLGAAGQQLQVLVQGLGVLPARRFLRRRMPGLLDGAAMRALTSIKVAVAAARAALELRSSWQGINSPPRRERMTRCIHPPFTKGAGSFGSSRMSPPGFFAAAGEEDHSLPRDAQPRRHDGSHELQAPAATRRSEACNAGAGGFSGACGRARERSFPQLFMRACASGAHPSALVDEALSLAAVLLLQQVRETAAGFEAGGQLRDHVSQEWRRGGSGACPLIGATRDAPGQINLASVRRCPRLPAW